ncbi:hypothetical protein MRX96_012085 [Rhipicephalus microplus]
MTLPLPLADSQQTPAAAIVPWVDERRAVPHAGASSPLVPPAGGRGFACRRRMARISPNPGPALRPLCLCMHVFSVLRSVQKPESAITPWQFHRVIENPKGTV